MKGRMGSLFGYLLIVAGLCAGIFGGSRAVTVIAERIPFERSVRMVIDPGHGGEDGGAVSCTGVPESTINLEIALRMEDLFHFLGYETVMIRTTDTAVHTQGNTIAARKMSDLKQRVRLVNETENGLLISIHQNTFSDSRYDGAQVFYAENEESRRIAEKVQEGLSGALKPGTNRRCKEAKGVYLMEHITAPGILVECGFLSNPEEEALLRSAAYQKKIASIICCAVAEFTALDDKNRA